MKELRSLLPVLEKMHYLNYAATGPLLIPSAEKMTFLVAEAKEPLQFHRDAWLALLESSRRTIAELIGASPEEIAFVSSTSSGLSLIANAIRWKEGDQIVYPEDEFPSNRFVWDNLKEKGVKALSIAPVPGVSFAEQLQEMDLSHIRLAAVSAVSYLDGRLHDIKALATLCHAKGILVAVDAIQAAGAIPIDVRSWDCDFLACGGQKWLFGPVGTGFVYIKKSRIEELFVPQVGWASSRFPRDFESKTFQFVDGARRFEPSYSDIPAVAALACSIETMKGIGWDAIHNRISQLVAAARDELKTLGISPLTLEGSAGILAFRMGNAEAIQKKLIEKKIIATQRQDRIRISLHAPVSDEDLSAFFQVLSGQSKSISLAVLPERRAPSSESKRALISGASSGLGARIAESLAKRGYSLLLIARRKENLDALAATLREKYGATVETTSLDLSDPRAVESLDCDVDFLANCAADADAELFSETDFSSLRKKFEVNFYAPLLFAQKVVRKKKGTILNIITGGGRCALPLFSAYSAAKGALWSWSESLQRELSGTGVQVTTFLPPHMDSETSVQLGRKALAYFTIGKSAAKADPAVVAEEAVTAALQGIPFVAPKMTRFKIALNALFPSFLSRAILKRWKR